MMTEVDIGIGYQQHQQNGEEQSTANNQPTDGKLEDSDAKIGAHVHKENSGEDRGNHQDADQTEEDAGTETADQEKTEKRKEEQNGANDSWTWPPTRQQELEYLMQFEGVTQLQRQSYLNFFKKADKLKVGYVTVQQFRDALMQMRFRGTTHDVANIFADLNPDEYFFLSVDAFMTEMCKEDSRKRTEKDMQEIFRRLDVNKDDLISVDDIEMTLKQMNKCNTEDSIRLMIRKGDIDRDGALSFQEFLYASKFK